MVPEVEIFSAEECGACDKLEKFLEEKGIAYEKHDILKDEEAKERLESMMEGGGEGVVIPVWCTDEECHSGYSEEKVEDELDI